MSFLGSKSKSQTTEYTTTQQWYTEKHDIDTVTGGAEKAITAGAGATVNVTDENIVEKALDFARFTYEEAGHNFATATEATRSALAETGEMAASTQAEIRAAYAQAEGKIDPTMLVIVLGAVLGIGLVFQLRKGR